VNQFDKPPETKSNIPSSPNPKRDNKRMKKDEAISAGNKNRGSAVSGEEHPREQ
jgi:hypothetical protein